MSGELMRLDNFRLDIGKLKEKFESTAKYIGIYDKIKSHLASICFDENENNKQLRFDGPMLLGLSNSRQRSGLPLPRIYWILHRRKKPR